MCSFYYPKLWTTLWFHHGATAWPGISRGRLVRVGRREMGRILWVSHAVRNDLAAEVFAGGGIDVWCPHIWKVIYRSAQKAWVLALPGRQDQLWEDLFILQMRLWKMWPGDRRLLLGNRKLHTLPSAQCIHYGIWLRWCRLRSESLFSPSSIYGDCLPHSLLSVLCCRFGGPVPRIPRSQTRTECGPRLLEELQRVL